MNQIYRAPTPIIFGWGSFESLSEHIPEGDCFMVLGGSSSTLLEIEGRVGPVVKGELTVFRGIEPNPLDTTVDRGASEMREADPEFVLAVGGGSVMDAAKVMAQVARHGGSSADYVTGRMAPGEGAYPLYAVPTTPGTSSEITPFSVITVPKENNKLAVRHPSLYPTLALIDPKLTVTLPGEQTVATGLDILSHAVESYWARRATPMTRRFSLDAVRLVRGHLKKAVENGNLRQHREALSLASVMAGLAFSNTGTTICHAISYPITMDTGLPHGMACALTLGPTFDLLLERGHQDLDQLAGSFSSTSRSFSKDLMDMMRELGVPEDLRGAGYTSGVDRILRTEMGGLLSNFPLDLKREDIRGILEKIG